MGSYLDKPETTKKSATEENEFLQIGSSSMQGWRINQEDAHNVIPNFADKVSFFAVYDGHGGAEVAEYCSAKLPDFLRELESFKNGDYEQALKDAFMGFDATLLEESVIEELRQIARKNPDYEESESEDMVDETAEEIINLHQEATMPLSEVLEKYKGNVDKASKMQRLIQFHNKEQPLKEAEAAGPSSSSSSSCGMPSGSGSSTNLSKPSGSGGNKKAASENEVSSSSSKPIEKESESNEPSSSSSLSNIIQPHDQAPDSTHTIPTSDTKPEQCTSESSEVNVDQSNGTNNKEKSSDDAISSSSVQENGEITNCSSSTSAMTSLSSSSSSSSINASKPIVANSASQIPNHISSSDSADVVDTESEIDTSDDEHDQTYLIKESLSKKLNSDDETTDEDMDADDEDLDEEELSNEEISGEEEEDDGLDNDFMNNMETGPGKASGCTAVVALLAGRDLYVANAGDSRCVVCRGGKVVEMSFDHKPEDDIEFQRIRKAGGRVTLDGRVNGGLNLSRAIGDHGYKMNKELGPNAQMISAMPDLKVIKLEPEDDFMVLACDGIWNYMSNEEVVGFVKQRIDTGKSTLAQICEELFHNCLAPNTMGDGTGCDNMTAIIVKFKPTLFELSSVSETAESQVEQNKIERKRSHDSTEAEAVTVSPSEKKAKLEDDLTPAAVDTSTA